MCPAIQSKRSIMKNYRQLMSFATIALAVGTASAEPSPAAAVISVWRRKGGVK